MVRECTFQVAYKLNFKINLTLALLCFQAKIY